ncbi:putative Asparagine synthetase [Nitrospira japonica]|uniref:asparagine synthase (glutamine-hydrolyzing) n=1 Tax=Nitrospira japonica TaxID=1325564 RepID=A0A1W1IA86_9BACT|nr:asparagine synthase (glutamine-hydrolyzing) [Nitrospira japonica]SLM49968.1 putative Asparagine synthetase [Nitrospira japonica]
MCGIGGWIGHRENAEVVARSMVRALRHRGPDGDGLLSLPDATLVHTRLSIIDLSPAGKQPMSNAGGTIWSVFNGEIYNHRELRRRLEGKGYRFTGHSDSEIIPYLYEEMGTEFVNVLRGMFAIALYDTRSHSLVLTRDRFGIKPLFYAPEEERLSFASEINALRNLPGMDLRIDRQAVYDYAALFYIPAPETFYRGIRALDAGELLEARMEHQKVTWRIKRHHRWTVAPDPTMQTDEVAGRVEGLLRSSVERQLDSDVPLGCLLSGGIDSSLVSTAAQQAIGGGLQTFNVRFSDDAYDETWAAKSVANHIGSDHTVLDMDGEKGTWTRITNLLSHAGQPFADTSIFALNAVCRLMRQHVTVALSGDGGDEGFGGYNLYWQLARIARLQLIPSPMWWAGAAVLTPFSRLCLIPPHIPSRLREFSGVDDIAIIQDLYSWIRGKELQRLSWDEGKVDSIRRLFEPRWDYVFRKTPSRIERLSALATEVNVRLVLCNDFLFKVDNASMKESLEVRVPMLDEDLFALGLCLPYHLKVHGKTCKIILREVAKRWLPPAVARKSKCGFGVPVDRWVDADFKTRLKEALLGRASRISEFFRPEVYRPIIEGFCDGKQSHDTSRQGLYQRIIMLLSLQLAISRKPDQFPAMSVPCLNLN